MIQQVGYSLIDESNIEVQFWGNQPHSLVSKPDRIILPNGDIAEAPTLNESMSGGYTLVERWIDDSPTTELDTKTGETTTFVDGKTLVTYSYELPSIEILKLWKKNKAATKRWEMETAGTFINGNQFATDRESQIKYTAVAVAISQADPLTWSINWKTSDGAFLILNATEMGNIVNTVMYHVQNNFNKESEFVSQIDACTTVEEVLAIDLTQGWPSNEYVT